MRLAERMATGYQSNGFLKVHRHSAKGFLDVHRRKQRIGVAIRAFWVYIDQPHLHGTERIFENTAVNVTIGVIIRHQCSRLLIGAFRTVFVTHIAAEPGCLGSPVNILIGFPNVLAAAAKAERLEIHCFKRDVPGKYHQVGPGYLSAVFLLDRPKQSPCLVEANVIGPAIERRKTLLSPTAAAAAVLDAICARAVPRHSNEKTAIMTKV